MHRVWEGEGERFVAGAVVSPLVAGLVLTSAAMHASWNALLKGGSDRLRSVTVMAVTTSVVAGLGALLLPTPRVASWGCIALSAALHVVYNLLLVACYRHGDLGVSYPIAGIIAATGGRRGRVRSP